MEKQNFLNLGKKLSASALAVVLTLSTASALPSFAAEETTDSSQLYATGCLPASKEVMEQHRASDEQIYDLEFVQVDDPATQDALVGICKAAKVASLPEKTELNHKYLPPVKNQGGQGSCAAWSTNYYMKTYMEAKEHDWDLSDGNKKHIFSPSFTYNQIEHYKVIDEEKDIRDYNDGGTYIHENLDVMVEQGACPLYDMKYDDTDGTTKPNASQKDMASNYKGSKIYSTGHAISSTDSWRSLPDIDSIKAYLDKDHPVVIQVATSDAYSGSSMIESDYVLHKPTISKEAWEQLSKSERENYYCQTGNHALCVVGYDENYNFKGKTVSVLKFVNSWGTDWADNGYGYITEEALGSDIYAYVIDDKSHDDTDDFFTSNPNMVEAKTDVRAYSSPDYFKASGSGTDNYAKTFAKGSVFGIKKFVSCSESNQQPYFITDDGYYINATKDTLAETTGAVKIINGDQNNSVSNYNNSESSSITITPNSNLQYNGHNALKVAYTMNQNDSYNGYAGAKISLDKSVSTNGATGITFKYMTPLGQSGTIALCLQGSVNKKIVQLPTTNGKWETFTSDYNFTSSTISDIELYINGNESGCQTTLSNGIISFAEMALDGVSLDYKKYNFTLTHDNDGFDGFEGDVAGSYRSGTKITVTAKVTNSIFKFAGWSNTKGGSIISTNPTYSFVLNGNTNLHANYVVKTKYYFSIDKNVEHATVSGSANGSYYEGTEVTATCTVDDGYKFKGWSKTKGGKIVSYNKTYKFKLNESTTLYPVVEKRVTYTVKFISNEGGSAYGPATRTEDAGSYLTVSAIANDGYVFKGWSLSEGGAFVSTYNPYSFTVNSDMTIYLTFEKIPEYTVKLVKTTGCAKVYMTYNNSDTATVREDTTIDTFATAQSGYTFKGWYDNASFSGNPVSTSSHYTFAVTSNRTLYPKFEKDAEYIFNICYKTGEGAVKSTLGTMYSQGIISGSCVAGTSITVTATPSSNYQFVGWCDGSYDGSILSTSKTYTFTVNGVTKVFAKFVQKPTEYIFNVNFRTAEGMVDYSQGNMYSQGTISGSCVAGTSITVTAKPRENYQFVGWCDGSYDGTVLSTNATYTFTVNKETNIYAKFVEKTVADDSNILVKGISNSISDWTNANSGSYLNITSGSSDYLFNGARTLKLEYNINTNDQYGGYAGRTVSLESTYKNDNSKGYNGIGFWYMTPADFNGQIALCLQSNNIGLDDLVQLPSTNGEWKYYFYQTNKTNLSDLTLYINGSKNGYTTTASNGIAKGTLYMANIEVNKK